MGRTPLRPRRDTSAPGGPDQAGPDRPRKEAGAPEGGKRKASRRESRKGSTTSATSVGPPTKPQAPAQRRVARRAPEAGAAPAPEREHEGAPGGALRTTGWLVLAAHPRQALATGLALAAFAALSGRSWAEVGLVLAVVITGQAILGWHNDLVDRERDRAADRPGKPLADGRLDPGTVWFAMAVAVLLLVPLAVGNGVTAASAYLVALAVGLLANVLLRGSWLSPLPWMAQFAIYPAFLSYGGYGGAAQGDPPEIPVVVLAALLGLGVHVLRALPGLVTDNRAGLRHLPLRLGLRLGATRLLLLSGVWTAGVTVALLLTVRATGIGQ